MAVSLTDTDIHESHCRRLLSMYRRTSDQSRNRASFFSPDHKLPHLLDGCTPQFRCPGSFQRPGRACFFIPTFATYEESRPQGDFFWLFALHLFRSFPSHFSLS